MSYPLWALPGKDSIRFIETRDHNYGRPWGGSPGPVVFKVSEA